VKADLHLHTWHSDGTEAPSEMVARAAALGFGAVAVTDHDTVDGVAEALEEGRRRGVCVVPGAEVTSRFGGTELHMLLYFNPACGPGAGWRHPELAAELARQGGHRVARVRRMAARLQELGVRVEAEEVLALAGRPGRPGGPSVAVGRPHVARALVAAGAASSIDEAFQRYLRKGAPAFVDKERLEVGAVLALARRAGGLAVLAHPGIARNDRLPEELLRLGVDGIEAVHSRHPKAARERYLRFAREHGLLATGGSDCHGNLKGEPLLGTVEFSGEELETFLARARALPS
jgi:predicted metal-dependent phosphoesterase TrpH